MTFHKIQTAFFCFLGALFLIATSSCSFTDRKCRKLYAKAKTQQYDMIVVPGVPLENGKWSEVMMIRICWAKFLYDRGIAKNVMFSGSAVYTPYVEAEVMALYAEAIGIPKEHIFTESKAEHSTENIFYSYRKARKLNFNKVALASDAFQTRMLKRFTCHRVSKDVDLIPMVYDSLRPFIATIPEPKIDPSPAFVKDFVPIGERQSFLRRLKGTIGWARNKQAYE